MLTVDFDRLGLRPGERVLDMGCGAGRHAFEMYRRGADVLALDMDADELATVSEWFAAMREEGSVPAGAEADVKQGDALDLPFPDGECADLVTPGDVGELYDAIGSLLDDPERRARMGAAGRRRVLDKFSWRAVAVATAQAYERAVQERTARPDEK